ncbi:MULTISPECIES: bifunctional folylpolyglutamate synthase/dihydrofolate synthase [Sphingomonas]|uniref:bifunctional folylpolyglutamate synthase/dihydrofolate synthase n=1 Tax=Sphingomonas TaxID=13687 RepID=UPI000DF0113D|nr:MULTISPECIES: bifunctional folylpolyglutamate synthase/dihydrofolate synthase [Sphingomonas]
MKEVIRSADPRVAALIARQATQYAGRDQLGLDRIRALLDRLGRPQDRLPPVFHVAGTNGKGSTCAFLRAALEAAGHRVHAFTSPHLVRYNERIRIAGTLISDDELAALMVQALDANEDLSASLFEVNTAVAFLAFATTPADACIVEVGLGGRLDATNVIEAPLVCGIAGLGIDHEAFLLADEPGTPAEPLARIGFEKAGIAKPGVPLVVQHYPAGATAAVAATAARVGAPLLVEGHDWHLDPTLHPSLPGPHQQRNASLAAAMLRAQAQLEVSDAALHQGVATATWPARMQKLDPRGPLAAGREVWLDGAHNAAAAQALADALPQPMHLVLGILASKQADAIVPLLARHALNLTFVPIEGHDCHDPQALAARYAGRATSGLTEALADLPGPILIAGSLYLAGEVLERNGELPT